MERRLSVIAALLCSACAFCAVPVPAPFAVITGLVAEPDTLRAGDSATESYEAPLHVELNAGLDGTDDGTVVYSEWRVTRTYVSGSDQVEEEYLLRQEAVTGHDFNDYGTFKVQYAYSYKVPGSDDIIDGESVSAIQFSVDDAQIEVPNAFSPNGDGINDIFKIKVRSIVSLRISIFNRWGQLITSGNEKNLAYEDDGDGGYYTCWDGTYRGKTVPDGVYFINVEATGAGGRKFVRKSDINVLKGLGTTGNQ